MNDSYGLDTIWKNNSILVLNPKKYDEASKDDSVEYIIGAIRSSFFNSYVFYFYDSILIDGIKKTEANIKNLIKENNISIVFFAPHGSNYELPVEFFKSLKDESRVKNVLWIWDDEMIFDTLSKYYAQVFDAAITCDYSATFVYQKLGIPSLYFFSRWSKKDFYPVNMIKDIDVSFLGDCTKADRIAYINYLKENGIKVETFGKGSENGFVKKENFSEIYSRTKINLNFTKVDNPSIYAWFLEDNALTKLVRHHKCRPIDAAMTRSFCLTEYAPFLGTVFEVGKDIEVFYNKGDLLKKVRYYLENEDMRVQMANNAYKKIVNNYDADIFIPKLMEKLCGILSNHLYAQREPIIYKDSIFKKNHINQLTFVMFYQLLKLKFRPALETFINLFQYGFSIFLIAFLKGTKRAILRMWLNLKKSHV